MLSTVALRYRVLKSESENIDKAEESRDKRNRIMLKESSPNKKRKLEDRNRSGRTGGAGTGGNESSGKLFSNSHRSQSQSSKLKNTISSSPAPSSLEDSMDAVPHMNQNHMNQQQNNHESNKLLLPRNDIPNKFWLSVEPYCMPITQEDIKLLDDLIEEYTGTVLPPIPELGPHYSVRWAMEEIKAEEAKNNAAAAQRKAVENGHATPRKVEKNLGDGVLGPLTQRLVSALMEENLVNAAGSDASNGANDQRNDVQSLMKNGIDIEKRLKKELVEQGILDAEDVSEEDDEILTEIKRVRAELTAIGEYNANELRKLHKAAVEEMKRLEIKKKLDAKDEEVGNLVYELFFFN